MPPHDPQTPKNTPPGWIDWNGEQAKKRAAEETRLRNREQSKKALFSSEEGRGSRLWTGLITAVAGVPSIMIGLGLWTNDSIVMAAPLMIIFCVGLLFVGGGLSFALGVITPELEINGALPDSAPKAARALQFFMSAVAASGFAGLATWVALTGGMRDVAQVLTLVFSYADFGALQSRLTLWVQVLAALLWIFALVGLGRGLLRMRDAKGDARW